MARSRRCDTAPPGAGGWFHVTNHVSGPSGFYPFADPAVRAKFYELLEHYLSFYCCRLAAECLLDNHYHLELEFQKFRRLSKNELKRLARLRFGSRYRQVTRRWKPRHWQAFNFRLFNLSAFMQDLQGRFAQWYCSEYDWLGPFWHGRFKHDTLLNGQSVQEVLLYIELNPVRAKLRNVPEAWKSGSALDRYRGWDRHLIPLEELFPEVPRQRVFEHYRMKLFYRGRLPNKEGRGRISEKFLRAEEEQGFRRPGVYLERQRFFSDGLVLGKSQEVQPYIDELREKKIYTRRRHPISQMKGLFFTLREQRSHGKR